MWHVMLCCLSLYDRKSQQRSVSQLVNPASDPQVIRSFGLLMRGFSSFSENYFCICTFVLFPKGQLHILYNMYKKYRFRLLFQLKWISIVSQENVNSLLLSVSLIWFGSILFRGLCMRWMDTRSRRDAMHPYMTFITCKKLILKCYCSKNRKCL